MTKLLYAGKSVAVTTGQTVLSALLQHGFDIPHACQAGACQSCIMQATSGTIPVAAQQGLKPAQIAQGYFLACCCEPSSDMEICLEQSSRRHNARVVAKELLRPNTLRLRLQVADDYPYHAGQYTTLWANSMGRSYSLASLPGADPWLEMHIRRVAGGQLSPWLFDSLQTGDEIALQAASGNCFYLPEAQDQPIILIGTGTGLAPLYGIVRDALRQGHRGEVHLIHGSVHTDGLYLHEELRQLEQIHGNLHYHACVLEGEDVAPDISVANIDVLAFGIVDQPQDWRVFLCGESKMVDSLKKRFFLAGTAMKNIYTDPFLF